MILFSSLWRLFLRNLISYSRLCINVSFKIYGNLPIDCRRLAAELFCGLLYYLSGLQIFTFLFRLTFWLSNTIVLRAIATSAAKKSKFASETCKGSHGNGGLPTKPSARSEHSNDWENPQIFALALERVEAWMFSRIVESVWWQVK